MQFRKKEKQKQIKEQKLDIIDIKKAGVEEFVKKLKKLINKDFFL